MFYNILGVINELFSERLKELREEKGLSQLQLAKALNYTQTTIFRWEGGSRTPSIEAIIILVKFFDCTADYLLGIQNSY